MSNDLGGGPSPKGGKEVKSEKILEKNYSQRGFAAA